MKFYETSAEDYIVAKESWNLHPQWNPDFFPKNVENI